MPSRRIPTYCPRCNRPGPPDGPLCDRCGEAIRPQGYCPICERRLFRSPGEDCPKHDVPLLDAPPEAEFDPASARLVTVAVFGLPAEAVGPRLRLDAEGIPTFLQDERIGGQTPYGFATGGLKLQVPEPSAADARVLLSQKWGPADGDDGESDDPWEGLAPEPAERRRSVMKGAILLYLFGPIVLFALAWLLSLLVQAPLPLG